MFTSTSELLVLPLLATLLRWAAAALVSLNCLTAVVHAEDPSGDAGPATLAASDESGTTKRAHPEEATLADGEREWGRDPGIGTTLSPTSMIIVGLLSAVVLGFVIWMVSYRKPAGAVHPYDEG